MTDIYIISGFLGAGKTTLIKAMVKTVFRDKRIVVIENDFGEAGIDAGLLRECSLTVTSLSDGCICCSLTGDFEKAVKRILEDYGPDAIVVEPSGVGKLSDIAKVCLRQEVQGKLYLRKAITVVDVRSFDKYRMNYGEFFEDQIGYGDLILFSHQKECQNRLGVIEHNIREMNPGARIEPGAWDCLPLEALTRGSRSSRLFGLEMEEAASMKPVRIKTRDGQGRSLFRSHFAREVFSSITLEWNEPLLEDQLRKKVLNVVEHAGGEILRGKGIVASGSHGLIFHFVPGTLDVEPAVEKGNQVCFIGTGLNEQEIRTLFNEK